MERDIENVNYILLGGNGYFGYNFIKYLLAQSAYTKTYYNIVVVDKCVDAVKTIKELRSAACNVSYIQTDLAIHIDQNNKPYTSVDIIKQINKKIHVGPVYIVNFAALSFVDTSLKRPYFTYQNNINEALTFCKIYDFYKHATGHETRAVHISTDEVFNRYEKTINERSPYSVSKDVIEDIILNTHTDIIILRPSNLFGCFDATDVNCIQRNPCVIKNLVNRIYKIHNTNVSRRFIHVIEACQTLNALCYGEVLDNLNYVNNNIMGYIAAARLGEPKNKNVGGVYVFNDDTEVNISELIKFVADKDKAEVVECIDDPRSIYQDYDYNRYYEILYTEINEVEKTKDKKISLDDIYEVIVEQRNQS